MMTTRSQQKIEQGYLANQEQAKPNEKNSSDKKAIKDKTTSYQDEKNKGNKRNLNLKNYFQQKSTEIGSDDKNKINTHKNSQNYLKDNYCFKIEFNRVCQDQPSLIQQCCWICLDLSSQSMYQCRQCDMYLCSSCNQLSALNKKCFNCSSQNSVRPITENKCLILKAAVFSCRFYKYGCKECLDSNQLQIHEKICEFSAKSSKEQSQKYHQKEQQKLIWFKRNDPKKKDTTVLMQVKEEENDEDDDGDYDEEENKNKRQPKEKLTLERKKPISKTKNRVLNNVKKDKK